MMKVAMATVALIGLAGCVTLGPAVEEMSNEAARAAAKAVVTPIVAAQVPGPAGVALSDCIIENATASELLQLARATGADAATVNLTSSILARPETVACATSAISA